MARFNAENADEVVQQGGFTKINYVKLSNDKDTVRARILAGTVDDIEGYIYHDVDSISAKGAKYVRKVDCLNEDGKHPEDCPFCQHAEMTEGKAGISKRKGALFLELLVYDKDGKATQQVWQRPAKFYGELSTYASRYNPLCGKVFDIVRNGAKGSAQTTYSLIPLDDFDKLTLEQIRADFPALDIEKNMISSFSKDKMMNHIAGVEDEPSQEQAEEQAPVTRRPSPSNTGITF